jgi:Mg-chelatase subunit ChlD
MRTLAALVIVIVTAAPGLTGGVRRQIHLDVVLLVDVSYSVTRSGFFAADKDLVPAAGSALADAFEPGDRVVLGTFGTAIVFAREVLTERVAILRAASVLAEPLGGPSPVWDAVDAAAAGLDGAGSGQVQRRRAVIVVTDGRTAGNRLRFAELLRRLEGRQVAVSVVALDIKHPVTPDPSVRLRQLANDTGGTYSLVKRDDVNSAVRRTIDALRRW